MDGELSPARAAELQRHLGACEACRRELAQLKQTASLVGSLAEVPVPPDLRARVQRKAAQVRPAPALACSSAREMLDEYAHGELDGRAAANLEAHLVQCQACGRELERLEQSAGLLRELAEVSPPARVRQRVQGELLRRSRPRYARPTFQGLMATAAAAAAAAVILLTRVPTVSHHPGVVTGERAPAPSPNAGVLPATPSLPATEGGATSAPLAAAGAGARPMTAAAPPATRKPARTSTAVAARASADLFASGLAATSEPRLTATPAAKLGTPGPVAARPAETPAPQISASYIRPAVDSEPAVASEELPRPHPAREAVYATAMPVAESPLSEVRRLLMNEQRSEAPTFKAKKRESDWFASGPIAAWQF
jgi:anti-sigma factor RsiW